MSRSSQIMFILPVAVGRLTRAATLVCVIALDRFHCIPFQMHSILIVLICIPTCMCVRMSRCLYVCVRAHFRTRVHQCVPTCMYMDMYK